MFEIFNDPGVSNGFFLGMVSTFIIFFIVILIRPIPSRAERVFELETQIANKLKESGYTVYRPYNFLTDLDLTVPLSQEEESRLSVMQVIILDRDGVPVTKTLALFSDSQDKANLRRSAFRVIDGGRVR